MCKSHFHRHTIQIPRMFSKRPPGGCKNYAAYLVGPGALKALPDGRMLTVHRKYLNTMFGCQPHYQRSCGHQSFLVGQGNVFTGPDGCHRWDKSDRTGNCGKNGISAGTDSHSFDAIFSPKNFGSPGAKFFCQRPGIMVIGNRYNPGPVFIYLSPENLYIFPGCQSNNKKMFREEVYHFQCLPPYGASAAQYRNTFNQNTPHRYINLLFRAQLHLTPTAPPGV